MAWTIYMDDKKVELPTDLNLQDRIELCEQIIENNYEYFDYQVPREDSQIISSEKVMIRLSVMGDYIIAAAPSDERVTITKYRERKIARHEILMDDV